jgi:hypothetical protein
MTYCRLSKDGRVTGCMSGSDSFVCFTEDALTALAAHINKQVQCYHSVQSDASHVGIILHSSTAASTAEQRLSLVVSWLRTEHRIAVATKCCYC